MQKLNRSTVLLLIGIALIIGSLVPYYFSPQEKPQSNLVIRAALDIGSGATKLRVAEVDLKSRKIVKLLVNTQFKVPYQRSLLDSEDNKLSEEVMQQGIDAIKESKRIAMENGASKIVAIATAAFRKAANSEEFIQRIYKDTNVPIFIIDQALEGELAFLAAQTQVNEPASQMVVWDIGGGSFQFTTEINRKLAIYRGHEASEPFKAYIITNIQQNDIKQIRTPNPMTTIQVDAAVEHAEIIADQVDKKFRDVIANPNTNVYGVGSVFSYGILPAVENTNPFTASDLTKSVKAMANLSDEELGGGDFADVQLSNAILVLGFMETLNIRNVTILDVNLADGAFFYNTFWAPEETKLQQKEAVSSY